MLINTEINFINARWTNDATDSYKSQSDSPAYMTDFWREHHPLTLPSFLECKHTIGTNKIKKSHMKFYYKEKTHTFLSYL